MYTSSSKTIIASFVARALDELIAASISVRTDPFVFHVVGCGSTIRNVQSLETLPSGFTLRGHA